MSDEYPRKKELRKIREWSHGDLDGLIEYVRSLWRWPERGVCREGRKVRLATGGWSGNEEIVSALQRNYLFWGLCWRKSTCGGLHVFKLPKPHPDDEPVNARPLEIGERVRMGPHCYNRGQLAEILDVSESGIGAGTIYKIRDERGVVSGGWMRSYLEPVGDRPAHPATSGATGAGEEG